MGKIMENMEAVYLKIIKVDINHNKVSAAVEGIRFHLLT